MDYITKNEQAKRTAKLADKLIRRRNWQRVANLIGGSPRYDHQDIDSAGESGSHPDDRELQETHPIYEQ
jgi:hypothetical protein